MIEILTEAGHGVGLGHLTRMRSLRDQLNEDGYIVRIIVHIEDGGSDGIIQMGANETARFWINDLDAFRFEITPYDIVVIDSYHTTESFMKDVSRICAKLVVIDDCNRMCYENCTVINPNYYGPFIDYPTDGGCEYYLGAQYALVRPEFRALKEREIRESVQRILITFGGTDVMDLTPRTIQYCHDIAPDAGLDIVITSSFSNIDAIHKALSNNDALYKDVDAVQMNLLMNQADFAIASAGSTSNELIKTGCPSVLIKVADNQSETIRYLEPLGYFRTFDTASFEKIGEMLSSNVRRDIHRKLRELETESSAKCLIEQIHDRFCAK